MPDPGCFDDLTSQAKQKAPEAWATWEKKYPNSNLAESQGICNLVRVLISTGHPRLAYDWARAGLGSADANSANLELEYLCALALTRGGNACAATVLVTRILSGTDVSDKLRRETLSLSGRILKGKISEVPADQVEKTAAESAVAYETAYEISPDAFPAINAATMWYVAGNRDHSRELATTVVEMIEKAIASGASADYWRSASLGEALILLGDIDRAIMAYQEAIQLAKGHYGDIASMARQLRMLKSSIPDVNRLMPLFNVGTVAVFSEEVLENPGKLAHSQDRWLPQDLTAEENVRGQIRAWLIKQNCRIAYSSAASGSDLLFAEEAQKLGIELHIVLPFEIEDFYQTSVDFGQKELNSWKTRCEAIIGTANEVCYATRERYLNDNLLFEFANQVMRGLALTKAAELGSETISLVQQSQERVALPRFIDTPLSRGGLDHLPSSLASSEETSTNQRAIKSMLFADVQGFSKLREEQTPAFFLRFLSEVAVGIETANVAPLFRNTWGDGLFLVYENATACANMALDLCERISELDLTSMGLPADMMVRIGIHAGPVYRYMDPILMEQSFFGSHVNRAARIEPVTTPGCVYASEQMAALLANAGDDTLRCEYIGNEELAKGYDTCDLFNVVRTGVKKH